MSFSRFLNYGFFDLQTVQKSKLNLSGKQFSWKKWRQLKITMSVLEGSVTKIH